MNIYLLGGPHFRGLRHFPPHVGMGSRQDCLGVGLRSLISLAPQGQVVMASGRSVQDWQGPGWQVSLQWWLPQPNVLFYICINTHVEPSWTCRNIKHFLASSYTVNSLFSTWFRDFNRENIKLQSPIFLAIISYGSKLSVEW